MSRSDSLGSRGGGMCSWTSLSFRSMMLLLVIVLFLTMNSTVFHFMNVSKSMDANINQQAKLLRSVEKRSNALEKELQMQRESFVRFQSELVNLRGSFARIEPKIDHIPEIVRDTLLQDHQRHQPIPIREKQRHWADPNANPQAEDALEIERERGPVVIPQSKFMADSASLLVPMEPQQVMEMQQEARESNPVAKGMRKRSRLTRGNEHRFDLPAGQNPAKLVANLGQDVAVEGETEEPDKSQPKDEFGGVQEGIEKLPGYDKMLQYLKQNPEDQVRLANADENDVVETSEEKPQQNTKDGQKSSETSAKTVEQSASDQKASSSKSTEEAPTQT